MANDPENAPLQDAPGAHGATVITTDFEVGVLLTSATMPTGTSTLASGK
jgi:hypothetical protein